jgi:hypothetical protein
MQVGDTYTYTDHWPAGSIPGWLAMQKEVPQGAKVFFSVLTRYPAETLLPPLEQIAQRCGVTERQASTYLTYLKLARIIRVDRHGRNGFAVAFLITPEWLVEMQHASSIPEDKTQYASSFSDEDRKHTASFEAAAPPPTPPTPTRELSYASTETGSGTRTETPAQPSEPSPSESEWDLPAVLRAYFGRPAKDKAANEGRLTELAAYLATFEGYDPPTQEQLIQAAAEGRRWWWDECGEKMPAGLGAFQTALCEVLKIEPPAVPETDAEPVTDEERLIRKAAEFYGYTRSEWWGLPYHHRASYLQQAAARLQAH